IIPSMQGFFVHISDGAYPVTGTLGLDNSVRISDLTHSFIKSDPDESKPLLRLTASFSDYPASTDPAVIYFVDNAETSFDNKFDALKLMNTDLSVPNLYGVGSDGSKLSINALPSSLLTGCTIPLGIKTYRSGNIVFKIPVISSQLPVTTLYLADLTTGINQNMMAGNEYSVALPSGEYPGRFFLYLNSSPTNITNPGFNELNFKAYSSEGMVIIDIDLPRGDKGTVIITNLTGKPLFSTKIFDSGHYEFDTEMKPGLYIITFINGIKKISRKIIAE
ncbi:MAG: C-terminal target protein, partial [Bacteroidetes bacterium]|nr:C-terminal target protein [Bacteroidota bacterium]